MFFRFFVRLFSVFQSFSRVLYRFSIKQIYPPAKILFNECHFHFSMNFQQRFIRCFLSYQQFIQKMWKTMKKFENAFWKTMKKFFSMLIFSLTFSGKRVFPDGMAYGFVPCLSLAHLGFFLLRDAFENFPIRNKTPVQRVFLCLIVRLPRPFCAWSAFVWNSSSLSWKTVFHRVLWAEAGFSTFSTMAIG